MRGAEILPPPGGSVAAFRLPTPARCDREAPTALREFSQGLALSPGRLPTRQCSPAMVSASRRMRKGSRGPPHPHTPGPFAIGAQRARPRRDQRPHGADQACAAVRPEERKVSLPASFKGHRRPELRSANSRNPLSSGWPLAGRLLRPAELPRPRGGPAAAETYHNAWRPSSVIAQIGRNAAPICGDPRDRGWKGVGSRVVGERRYPVRQRPTKLGAAERGPPTRSVGHP